MQPSNPPSRAPTAAELLQDAEVQAALDQAWIDSAPGDPMHRHEEGGWIYLDVNSGSLTIQRATRGTGAGIDLSKPPLILDRVVVGKFHTHPNPTAEGWIPGPSEQDELMDDKHGVPDLIRADDGIHFSGPLSRRGGLAGGPGFPPE
jgi:hypothetical protein